MSLLWNVENYHNTPLKTVIKQWIKTIFFISFVLFLSPNVWKCLKSLIGYCFCPVSDFFIYLSSSPEDHLPPSVVTNKGLVLDENSVKKLTTLQLSASDQDSEPGELVYRITKQTSLGQLEHVTNPGRCLLCFLQQVGRGIFMTFFSQNASWIIRLFYFYCVLSI